MGDGWVGDGYRTPADDVIAVEALQVSLQLYNPSTWSTRRYTRPAEALQLYSPLQLYSSTSSTVYIPLQHPSAPVVPL